MKTTLEKPVRGTRAQRAVRPARSRTARNTEAMFATKNFWRALSLASLASPHTPVLRRLHD